MLRKSEILLFLKSLYVVFKDFLGFNNHKVRVLHVMLTILFAITASVICIICISPFFFFYYALNVYLKLKIGRRYAGLLKGQDSTMECESKKLIINVLIIINRKTPYEDFCRCVLKYMRKAQRSSVKLSYIVNRSCGYYYFTKDNLNIEDYLDVIDYSKDFLTKEELHNFLIENCFDERLLKNKMWHLTMFKQPIKWSQNAEAPQQAFVCTIRHSLCDGMSILGLLKNKVFRQMEIVSVESQMEEKQIIEERYVYKNCFLPHDTDARIKPTFQTGEFLSFFVEEAVGYVPLVKEIKKKLKVQFSDVLVAAIASAVDAYAKKKKHKLHRHIASVAISPFLEKNKQMLSGNFNFDQITNNNGILHFGLPENTITSMVQKTLRIHETSRRAQKASEVLICQVLTKFLYIIPTSILSPFLDGETQPACFELSNLSSIKSCVIGENSLESAIFFTTQFFKVGFLFGVLTVGDKFQMSVKSDKGMVESQEELNEILQDVFHYLEELVEEIRFISANKKII